MSFNTQNPPNHLYCMNPISRRSVVIGGRKWKELVRDRIIDPITNEPIEKKNIWIPVCDDVKEPEDIVIEDIDNLASLVADFDIEKIDNEKLSDAIAQASKNVMNKYKNELSKIEDEEDLFEEIKKLINQELKLLIYTE